MNPAYRQYTTVIAEDIPRIERAIRKANARLERAGIAGAFILEIIDNTEQVLFAKGGHFVRELVTVVLHTPAITAKPGRLIGRAERLDSGEVLVTPFGHADVPMAAVDVTRCDHCQTNRQRHMTYLVDTGTTLRQIGSTCLEAYTGINPNILEAPKNALSGHQIDDNPMTGAQAAWPLEDVISHALEASNDGQNYAGTDHGSEATVEHVRAALAVHRAPGNLEGAQRVIEWAQTLPESTNTAEWTHRIGVLARSGYVRKHHLGLATSTVLAYAQAHPTNDGGFIGNEGAQLNEPLTVTVRNIRKYKSNYGFKPTTEAYVTLEDTHGRTLLWKTQNPICRANGQPQALHTGDVLILTKATVKTHETWQGRTRTRITRPTLCLA